MSTLDHMSQQLTESLAEYEEALAEYKEAIGQATKIANEPKRPMLVTSCAVEAKRTEADEREELDQESCALQIETKCLKAKSRKLEAKIRLHGMALSFVLGAFHRLKSGDKEGADLLINFVKHMYEKYGGKNAWERTEKGAEAVMRMDVTTLLAMLEGKQKGPKTIEELIAKADGGSKDVVGEPEGGDAAANAPGGQEDAANGAAR